ncbi:MAG: GntR family transcriptional regulator [Lentisphaeria bacterium]|nr:GntR family transcriptional regulator [Lentisphaeria bacterium]
MPVYHDVAERLKKIIKLGTLKPGEKLPAELELCRMFSLSRKTVRAALAELESEGLILRRKKGGTTIAEDAEKLVDVKFRIGVACGREAELRFRPSGGTALSAVDQLILVLLQEGYEICMFDSSKVEEAAGFDGVLMYSPTLFPSLQNFLAAQHIPHVGFDVYAGVPGSCAVTADDENAVRSCVAELYDRGFREIAFTGGPLRAPEIRSGIRRRTESFIASCRDFGLSVREERIFNTDSKEDNTSLLLENFTERVKGCDAIICSTGSIAAELEQLRRICGKMFFPQLEMYVVDVHPFTHPELWNLLEQFPGYAKPHLKLMQKAGEVLWKFMGDPAFVPGEFKIPYDRNRPLNNQKGK